MWEEVQSDDRTTLLRCAAIMGQMQVGYDHVSVDRLQSAMNAAGVRVFYYRDGNVQLVLVMRRNPILGRWVIFGMGFFGATPAQSSDVFAKFLRDFMVTEEVNALFTLFHISPVTAPLGVDLRSNSNLQIQVQSKSEIGESWKVQAAIGP